MDRDAIFFNTHDFTFVVTMEMVQNICVSFGQLKVWNHCAMLQGQQWWAQVVPPSLGPSHEGAKSKLNGEQPATWNQTAGNLHKMGLQQGGGHAIDPRKIMQFCFIHSFKISCSYNGRKIGQVAQVCKRRQIFENIESHSWVSLAGRVINDSDCLSCPICPESTWV